jgi:hypothetical protein
MAAMEKSMAKAFGLEGDAWQRHARPPTIPRAWRLRTRPGCPDRWYW